jgi:hypothetical protein
MGALFASILSKLGLSSVLSWLTPLFSGAWAAMTAIFTGVCEIVAALAQSAEGRVVLAILIMAAGLGIGRVYWIDEGRELARADTTKAISIAKMENAKITAAALAKQKAGFHCPAPPPKPKKAGGAND